MIDPFTVPAIAGTFLLTGFRMWIPLQGEAWAGPLFGTANGVLTGMTGSFVVPGAFIIEKAAAGVR